MDNAKKIIEYLNKRQEFYRNKEDLSDYAMVDIIETFKGKSGEITERDLEFGFFRSLEANFVRHPKSYRVATDVDLENNDLRDLEVCKELVKLFRTVAEIERGEK